MTVQQNVIITMVLSAWILIAEKKPRRNPRLTANVSWCKVSCANVYAKRTSIKRSYHPMVPVDSDQVSVDSDIAENENVVIPGFAVSAAFNDCSFLASAFTFAPFCANLCQFAPICMFRMSR